MLKFCTCWVIGCMVLSTAFADDRSSVDLAEWQQLKKQPITESNFRAICDLLQDIGKSDINQSYAILSEYVPMVKRTGNRAWLHILLMGWAKAKESMSAFPEAEQFYRQARENAYGDPRRFDEALVGTVLMYAEWDHIDSLDKYLKIGKAVATAAGDMENLSFLFTFGAVGHMADTARMGGDLQEAIRLAEGLPNKNALFTARYNFASIYSRNDPQRQVTVFRDLLDLAGDSTLTHKYKLYERTAFCFRNPRPSILFQLMQVNLLLGDYDNAGRFATMLYDSVVKPNPAAPQAPLFTAELAIIKAYQGDYNAARQYLDESRRYFRLPEEKIYYPSYFLAAGMIDEHEGKDKEALEHYRKAYEMGGMEGLHLEPSELYYAHALIRMNRLDEAAQVLQQVRAKLPVRTYTAYGLYYYQQYAGLLRARGDYSGYGKALEQYYSIKDSLTSLNHYRAIEEIEARVRLRDKEQQIIRLKEQQQERERRQRTERIYFSILLGLALVLIVLLIGYLRNRIAGMRKQHRIDVMQGAMDAEERERHKIADQLHDEVGGLLSLAGLNLSSVLEGDHVEERSLLQLKKAREVVQTVGTTVRELSHRLTPLIIEKYGMRYAVEDLVETVNLSGKLTMQLVLVGFGEGSAVRGPLVNEVYRILQELVQNVVRHAHATAAMMQLIEHPDRISIVVEDNGKGIDEGGLASGKGLDTIRKKIAYFNGHMEMTAQQGKGTIIVIELPFENT